MALRLVWDHYVPYAHLGTNPDGNWAAACHVCNGIKSDHLITLPLDTEMDGLDSARAYIQSEWRRQGWQDCAPPDDVRANLKGFRQR